MDLPKSGWSGVAENWRRDLFAGFVVSLIALPLGLGLAIASGAPPIAGIITAVVGGIIVSILGGSFVTITGPGNGLAVATLAAVSLLGAGNDTEGFYFTLAAIITSGVILFLLGVLRFGSISDFFPSAAVEGMLAAIGLIIISNQIHTMLGVSDPKGDSTIELLIETFASLKIAFSKSDYFVPAIGLISLGIMFFYSNIRGKIFHLIPAPMWVVLLGILLSFYLEFNDQSHAIPKEFLISIPDNLMDSYIPPNFSKFWSPLFWNAVVTLTLIASIESLLSIKGVERLDFFKRRANVNRDLKAHGVATVVSGLLGGLNVVTVIARSSVNVNNGAVTRASNLFHGLIILLVILFLDEFITRIPLPALSAILVFTGYKLASPKTTMRIAKIGWEALTIYLLTLLITISTGIITGIICGIIVAFVLQLITTKKIGLILRNLFRPNTLLYQEEDGAYILSVKKYSNFLNFTRIRQKLDSIPSGSNIVLDLTLCQFVDSTVMENLHNYDQLHRRKGGGVEIVGLDNLQAASDHPFAPWVPLVGKSKKKKVVLSKRQIELSEMARDFGLKYFSNPSFRAVLLNEFEYFRTKSIDAVRNQISGLIGESAIQVYDLDCHMGEFIARDTLHISVVNIILPFTVPQFILDKEDIFDKMAFLAGFKDINFDTHKEFSKRFTLKGNDDEEIRSFFTNELLDFLETQRAFHIESVDGKLLIFEKERFSTISEIKLMVNFASQLTKLLLREHKLSVDVRT